MDGASKLFREKVIIYKILRVPYILGQEFRKNLEVVQIQLIVSKEKKLKQATTHGLIILGSSDPHPSALPIASGRRKDQRHLLMDSEPACLFHVDVLTRHPIRKPPVEAVEQVS